VAQKILLVDDASFMRMMLKNILVGAGYEVAGEAENGVKAIEQFKALKPDLVIMDIIMPEMGGIEATRRIVADLPETFVILCSTYDISDLPPDATASGARAYVNKEQLGATTLRRLWDQRNEVAFAT